MGNNGGSSSPGRRRPSPPSPERVSETTTSVDRVIVIGASSGGVDALRILVGGLPGDFATPICIVLHVAPSGPGILHQILDAHAP